MEATSREIVFDSESIKRAKQETKARILEDKKRVSEAVWPILDHIAEQIFVGSFDATALRHARMPDGKRPKREALNEMAETLGLTLAPYIKQQRLSTAKRLLETTALDVREIADIVCGVRARAFSTDFRDWEANGRTPEAYRKAEGKAIYSPKDWLRAWLWFWIGTVTDEHFEMMLAMERAQMGTEEDDEFASGWAEGIEAFLTHKGLESTLKLCRQQEACTGEVFEALSRRSREEGRRDRQRGLELAEVALAVVEGSLEQLGPRKADYLALGWARLGNARRLASDLEGAELAILEAESWAKEALEVERVQAELLLFKGSLRLFQRRFDQALAAYGDAIALSQAAGEKLVLIDALFQRGTVHFYLGEPAEALPDLEMADQLLPPEDRRRRLVSLHNRLHASVLGDDQEQVRLLLPRARRLSEEVGDRPSFLQTQWLEGMLLREDGDFEGAESLLKEARAGFIQLHDPGMTAVCSLELAHVFREQGRRADVVSCAVAAFPALAALEVPEALGALALLRQAIGEGEVSRSVLDLAYRQLLQPQMNLEALKSPA